jgi:hypothetical protein
MQKVDALTVELSQMATTNSNNDNHTPKMSQRQMQIMHKIPKVLPHECVFAIQIGSEMFKLSGVSVIRSSEQQVYPPADAEMIYV